MIKLINCWMSALKANVSAMMVDLQRETEDNIKITAISCNLPLEIRLEPKCIWATYVMNM